jgi:uncharacterized protein YndB with AHSA1/START domain
MNAAVGSVLMGAPSIETKMPKAGAQNQIRWKSNPRSFQRVLQEGEILEIDPPTKLVTTFVALWGDDVTSGAHPG